MTAQQRRDAIRDVLTQAAGPVIVGDIALLRAGGAAIEATARGYVVQRDREGLRRQVACRHQAADMERELKIMVDNGCTVLDVIVEHPVYGQLTGGLGLASRYDIQQFIRRAQAARPLSLLTEGVHLHTLSCPDQEAFLRVRGELAGAGFLLE